MLEKRSLSSLGVPYQYDSMHYSFNDRVYGDEVRTALEAATHLSHSYEQFPNLELESSLILF